MPNDNVIRAADAGRSSSRVWHKIIFAGCLSFGPLLFVALLFQEALVAGELQITASDIAIKFALCLAAGAVWGMLMFHFLEKRLSR